MLPEYGLKKRGLGLVSGQGPQGKHRGGGTGHVIRKHWNKVVKSQMERHPRPSSGRRRASVSDAGPPTARRWAGMFSGRDDVVGWLAMSPCHHQLGSKLAHTARTWTNVCRSFGKKSSWRPFDSNTRNIQYNYLPLNATLQICLFLRRECFQIVKLGDKYVRI